MNKEQELPVPGPYRTPAKIEKEIVPTRFQKFIDWWKDEDHYVPVIFITVIVGLLTLLGRAIYSDIKNKELINKSTIDHGVSVCQKDYYVKTEYPAVGLTKIVCLSASGEEKDIFEETNK